MKIDAEKHTKILIGFIVATVVVMVAKQFFTETVVENGRLTTKFKKPSLKKNKGQMTVLQTAENKAA